MALIAIVGLKAVLDSESSQRIIPNSPQATGKGGSIATANCHIPASTAATVKRVVDGDTIVVKTNDEPNLTVRLDQIDAPERGQPWGRRSTQMLARMALAKEVCLVEGGSDRYGRTIATIFVGDLNLNREMVSQGGAWAYRKYLRDPSLLDLEKSAENRGVGLWSMPADQRIPPWDARGSKEGGGGSNDRRPLAAMPALSPGACEMAASCKMLGSCDAARERQRRCGGQGIDGDGDGIPCEKLCNGDGR